MADTPQKNGAAERSRPLSPHLTIYRWQVTMLASITHRATGIALAVGSLALAWWLAAISNGPDAYEQFLQYAGSPLGLLVLFGFTWSLSFHLLNGVRHLAWDLGYGFNKHTATKTGTLVYVLSLLIAAAFFFCAWSGHGGYLA
jgi:succinate dehydrogenase / fumarate reductase cytochrome b subunit